MDLIDWKRLHGFYIIIIDKSSQVNRVPLNICTCSHPREIDTFIFSTRGRRRYRMPFRDAHEYISFSEERRIVVVNVVVTARKNESLTGSLSR